MQRAMILPDDRATHERAAAAVRAGGVMAFRTDTFYGLGADPFNVGALLRIFSLKGREEGKPILVVIADADEADRFMARRTAAYDALSARLWPGALTLVVPAAARVPDELTAGTKTVGLRLPADEDVRSLVRACGGALTATSANPSGRAPARTAAEVAQYFMAGLDLIIDGGAARLEQPSTVVDVTGEEARLIREGALSWREVREAAGPAEA